METKKDSAKKQAFHIIQKVLFIIQNDQTRCIRFFCIKNFPSMMLPVLSLFWGKKGFLNIMTPT